MNKRLLYLLFAILTLPLLVFISEQAQRLLSRAAYQPANIVIDTQTTTGIFSNGWNSHAQGGEEPPPMLTAVAPKLKTISPRFIRLDHIYDYYNIVKKKDNNFEYDFSLLDKTVEDIISTGALPFLSLSYMPSAFTTSGAVIDIPSNWNWWQDLIKATIQHYSGKSEKNLTNVYYEVWNEPDLPQFGGWKLGGDKDYRLLYYYASAGAASTTNVNTFYFGGPAVGSYYPNWVTNFVSYVSQNNLRLDFYSWHRYHKNSNMFSDDAKNIRRNLSAFPKFAQIPLVISEWGIESENTPINNSNMAAAFTVASIAQFYTNINLAFSFEVKDGPPPGGGKWGLFTHEKDSLPLSSKPRLTAYEALNKLSGSYLQVAGEGTFIKTIVTKSEQNITAVIANYDRDNKNVENVPITFTNLSPASYNLKYTYPLEKTSGTYQLISTNGSLGKTFLMSPNSILILELSSEAPIASFIPGRSGQSQDQAIVLSNNAPLILQSPEFRLRAEGTIGFDMKPLWDPADNKSFLIFDVPYSTESGIINKLFLAKQKKATGNFLTFGIASTREEVVASIPIDNWTSNTWHHIETSWRGSGISLTIDSLPAVGMESIIDIRNGQILRFYPVNAALDNLKIILGKEQTIERFFDGKVDK